MEISNKNQFVRYFLLIAGILVVLNMVSRTLFFRWDATDSKMYSLSDASREVIRKLDDQLVAKVYFSGNMPGAYANSRRYLQDLLEEYQAFSDGRFRFEFLDPAEDTKAQEQARNYNIPPVQLQAIENDKMEIKNVYMGLVFLYHDKKETIPVIQTTQGLEYNLTATIKKITATNLKTVGIISEENEEITTQNLSRFLEQLYTIQRVNLSTDIPSEIQAIMMNGVSDSLKSDELYHLDQFVMRGGQLFIAQGSVKDFLQQGFATEIRSNVFLWLEHYGVKIGKELLTDARCSQIQIQTQQGPFVFRNAIDYPVFPLIQKFNTDHLITKGLTQARVFFVSELSQTEGVKTTFTPLMFTSDKTGVLPGPFFQIQPNQNPMMQAFAFPSKCVAGLIEGTMTSFFAGDSVYSHKSGFIPVNNSGRILIITDNQFFNDRRGGGVEENTEWILNAVDYLTGDQELIAIRARDVTLRPLQDVSETARKTLKWINIILPAVLIVLLGLYRWKRNRDRRKLLEELYA